MKERRSKSEKVQKRRTEGRNKAEREAIPTAIVRKPCKDCGPISAPPCVREFISSSLLRSFSSSFQPRFLQQPQSSGVYVRVRIAQDTKNKNAQSLASLHVKQCATFHREENDLTREKHPVSSLDINSNFLQNPRDS